MVKKRKILEKDKKAIASYINDQLKLRKDNEYRKKHEKIWKEVDRQVYMEPMARKSRDPNVPNDWRSALELGELSRASEILTADIRKLIFPQNRSWFEPHSRIDGEMMEDGSIYIDPFLQKRTNGRIRALMTQQHLDFGLKGRVDLSVKESLHHGSYVVEVKTESLVKVSNGSNVQQIKSPVWVPHSMWKCYPENHFVNNMFYSGSMIIVQNMRYGDFRKISSPGWFDIDKVDKKKDDEDVEIVKYFGDISIPRSDGEIHYPNSCFYAVKDRIVYYEANPLPYPKIIYNGYERLDVRDPYFVSPLVKMSPTQKIASTLANKLIDSVEKWVEPPIEYDGNDPDLVASGGPQTYPGAKNPRRSSNAWEQMKVGDPQAALLGTQFFLAELQKGSGVDAIRSGMSAGTEQTATEVERTRQGGQLRTIDFVDKHELHGLRPFLYMQHELNKKDLKDYKFYNPEVDAPDFEIVDSTDLPKDVHFEVVGSRGLLEEEQRQAQTLQVTQFWLQFPQTAGMLNLPELVKQSYQDAGNKNPETFMVQSDPAQQQVEQIMQEAQQQLQMMQDELTKYQFQDEEHSLENEGHELEKEELRLKIQSLAGTVKFLQEQLRGQKAISSQVTQ